MSSDVHCDRCKAPGRRRMGTLAPDGWFYLEARDNDDAASTIIVWACSETCAGTLWQPGPGRLDLREDAPR